MAPWSVPGRWSSSPRHWRKKARIERQAPAPFIDEAGTGRRTAENGLKHGISLPVITLALYERLASQTKERWFAHKAVAALRNQFGGHAVRRNRSPTSAAAMQQRGL
jgi:6-phosphogluconate dehydrogenase (decarboxylating)